MAGGAPDSEHSWVTLAEKLGGEIHFRNVPGGPVIQVPVGRVRLTADSSVSGLIYVTRTRALYVSASGFHFRIRSARASTELGKMIFGMQDILTGDPHFDRRFVVQGNDVERTRDLFSRPRIRDLVSEHRTINLVAHPVSRWSGGGALSGDTEGIDELYFLASGPLPGDRLERVIELYRAILEGLEEGERRGRDDVEMTMARLDARGGVISQLGLVLWDGDGPRRDAATRLGRLGDTRAVPSLAAALDADDADLRAAAAGALGRLGDERATGPLVGLLADRARSGTTTVSEVAKKALETLGAGDLVAAFRRALEGDGRPLRRRVGGRATHVAKALLAVLEGSDLHVAEEAGKVLGWLGVMSVLAELRRIERTTGWDRTRTACQKAIIDLESMASLPRPADPHPGGEDTLPRVAGAPDRDITTLPRPVTGDDGGPTPGEQRDPKA